MKPEDADEARPRCWGVARFGQDETAIDGQFGDGVSPSGRLDAALTYSLMAYSLRHDDTSSGLPGATFGVRRRES